MVPPPQGWEIKAQWGTLMISLVNSSDSAGAGGRGEGSRGRRTERYGRHCRGEEGQGERGINGPEYLEHKDCVLRRESTFVKEGSSC